MYIFNFQQYKLIVSLLALYLGAATIFSKVGTFQMMVLIGGSLAILGFVWVSELLNKKLSILGVFGIATSLSFAHFLLNINSGPLLISALYSVSFLTLFVILVTNFQDSSITAS